MRDLRTKRFLTTAALAVLLLTALPASAATTATGGAPATTTATATGGAAAGAAAPGVARGAGGPRKLWLRPKPPVNGRARPPHRAPPDGD
ncbi:hypothetical protein ACFUJ0_35220, partial [Streptomyces sp. NPDC057242]|uniref:hypothetical protein n=1 Tax=Streptomyces sp. NPDC057242 TaxID=3346063 RepID=UPI003626EE29